MTDFKYFTTNKKGEVFELKAELNSEKKEKKKEAVKKVIAAMTVGKDVSCLFPNVVNCMQTDNLGLKKLVYLYLMNYAKSQPDMAIMAVNSFVKVVANAVAALSEISESHPNSNLLDLNPQNINKLLTALNECTERGQIFILDCLSNYNPKDDQEAQSTWASHCCGLSRCGAQAPDTQAQRPWLTDPAAPRHVGSSQTRAQTRVPCIGRRTLNHCATRETLALHFNYVKLQPHICERVTPWLSHANSAVVLSAVKVLMKFLELLPKDSDYYNMLLKKLALPLVTLLSGEPEVQYVALRNINLIIQKRPEILKQIKVFFVTYNDPIYVKLEKLDIMLRLASQANIAQVLAELKEYATEVDVDFVRTLLRAIGRCAIKVEI
ncbi:AP-2 complex subunit beta-like [Globicephala melas]|uniref:AP-2 complex subunit beta-like n=1 Tax=Globicephala melas TaxID=9731 RepID=UPI003872FEE8